MKMSLFLMISVCWITPSFSQFPPMDLRAATGNLSQYLMNAQRKNTEMTAVRTKVTEFNNAPNTIGKRFLFDYWVKGDSLMRPGNGALPNSVYLFNYDKLTGKLIGTKDSVEILAASAEELQSFILIDGNRRYRFVKLEEIDPSKFYLTLAGTGNGYTLYKSVETKLTKANFRSDGLIQTGSRDDEYKDESEYYLFNPGTGKLEKVDVKPRAIRKAFAARKSDTDRFFRLNWEKHIDEGFLIGLVNYVNGR